MAGVIGWITANWALILGVLFGISEALSLIPGVQANGVFQLIVNILKALKPNPPQLK
jgi:TctA family transporter